MNKNKTTPFIIGIIVIVAVVAFVLVQRSAKREASYKMPSPTPATETPAVSSPQDTKSGVKEYTLAEVAAHNSKSSCWTTINGGVYNVTSWIPLHPGGEARIIALCGIDGSDAFNGQHGGQARPASELASFKIGTLKK